MLLLSTSFFLSLRMCNRKKSRKSRKELRKAANEEPCLLCFPRPSLSFSFSLVLVDLLLVDFVSVLARVYPLSSSTPQTLSIFLLYKLRFIHEPNSDVPLAPLPLLCFSFFRKPCCSRRTPRRFFYLWVARPRGFLFQVTEYTPTRERERE